MRPTTYWLLIALAVTAVSSCRNPESKVEQAVGGQARIDHVGHGVFMDTSGRVVTPTPERVIESQKYYVGYLYDKADAKLRDSFDNYRREVLALSDDRSAAVTILLNAAQLSWLLQNVHTGNSAHLGSLHTALWGLVRPEAPGKPPQAKGFGVSTKVYDRLLSRVKSYALYATPASGSDYVDECRRAGVPVPPDWGSTQWRGPTPLGTNFLAMQGSTPLADMYVFESEQGMCAALPRHDGKTIKALGVICMGVQSSKSCFWDNQRNKQNFDIPLGSRFSIVNDFAGGADLRNGSGGVCTDCHAGENAYIVHPRDPAMNFARELPANWNQPLVHPAWPQNRGPDTVLAGVTLGSSDRSCLDCHKRPGGVEHRFPIVSTETPGYCQTVLPKSFSLTMPSATNPGPYMRHFNALIASCSNPPPGDGTQSINGGIQADPIDGRTDTTGTLTSCAPGAADCPVGFCYWKAVHGPFWQTSPAGVRPDDPSFRGSFLRIFAESGRWKWRAFSDTTGGAVSAPPGGVAECAAFGDLAGIVNANASSGSRFEVADVDGTRASQSIDATLGSSNGDVFPLTGFVGNVAHVFNSGESDVLRATERGGRVNLAHRHRLTPISNYPVAPLVGESWTFQSPGWIPTYLARDVLSTDDVELVSAVNSSRARCYITGIAGAWSSTSRQGGAQPFAEIFKATSGETRLRVWPNTGRDRVWAYASCIASN